MDVKKLIENEINFYLNTCKTDLAKGQVVGMIVMAAHAALITDDEKRDYYTKIDWPLKD